MSCLCVSRSGPIASEGCSPSCVISSPAAWAWASDSAACSLVCLAHGPREFELEDLVERRGDGFGVDFHCDLASSLGAKNTPLPGA
jgi:hypothetical protein